MIRILTFMTSALMLAACQTTSIDSDFIDVSPTEIGLTFWLPDEGFPPEFGTSKMKRSNSTKTRYIGQTVGRKYATLWRNDAVGNWYWTGIETIHKLASIYMDQDTLNLVYKDVMTSPLGNFNMGVFKDKDGYCLSAVQNANPVGPGYQDSTTVLFCDDTAISKSRGLRILSGVGVDRVKPHESLKP